LRGGGAEQRCIGVLGQSGGVVAHVDCVT